MNGLGSLRNWKVWFSKALEKRDICRYQKAFLKLIVGYF